MENKNKKIYIIIIAVLSVVVALLVVLLLLRNNSDKNDEKETTETTNNILEYFTGGDEFVNDYYEDEYYEDDSIVYSEEELIYFEAENMLASGNKAKAAILFGQAANYGYSDARERSLLLWDEIADRKQSVSAGFYHTLGVNADGTVSAVGFNNEKQCNVFGWRDVVSVSFISWLPLFSWEFWASSEGLYAGYGTP